MYFFEYKTLKTLQNYSSELMEDPRDLIIVQLVVEELVRRLRNIDMRTHASNWASDLCLFYDEHGCSYKTDQRNLELTVIAASAANNFVDACQEFDIVGPRNIKGREWTNCVCRQQHLDKCYYIINRITGTGLMIGDVCIERFKKRDPAITSKSLKLHEDNKRSTPEVPSTALQPLVEDKEEEQPRAKRLRPTTIIEDENDTAEPTSSTITVPETPTPQPPVVPENERQSEPIPVCVVPPTLPVISVVPGNNASAEEMAPRGKKTIKVEVTVSRPSEPPVTVVATIEY